MPPRPSAPFRCTSCGSRTKRRLENASKGCSKCGGRLTMVGYDDDGDDQTTLIICVVIAAVFMLMFAVVWETTG